MTAALIVALAVGALIAAGFALDDPAVQAALAVLGGFGSAALAPLLAVASMALAVVLDTLARESRAGRHADGGRHRVYA